MRNESGTHTVGTIALRAPSRGWASCRVSEQEFFDGAEALIYGLHVVAPPVGSNDYPRPHPPQGGALMVIGRSYTNGLSCPVVHQRLPEIIMSRKTANIIRTLISAATITGLSACTSQQRLLVDNVLHEESPVTSSTPIAPSMTYQADCAGVTLTTSGWPDGSSGILGINGEPPYSVPTNTTGHWAPSLPVIGGYGFDIDVRGPGLADQAVNSVVLCGLPAPPPELLADVLP